MGGLAAAERRERVGALADDRRLTKDLTIGTFHARGLQILRSERKALGVPRGFTVYDGSDQLGIVREAMRAIHDGDRRLDAKAILTRISLAKNAFIAPEEYEGNPADDYDAMTVHVYPKYQEHLRSCAAFDFDDLLVEPVRLWRRDEAATQWVAREITTLVKAGRRGSDIAILYRSNIQAKLLEEELRTHEVPYVMYGGQQFYERKEVKDVIAYLRVAVSPRDELALRRVINYLSCGVGAGTIEKLVTAAHSSGATLWDARATTEGTGPARTGIEKFKTAVERVRHGIENGHDLVEATKGLSEDIGLYDDLRAASPSMSAAQRRIDNMA